MGRSGSPERRKITRAAGAKGGLRRNFLCRAALVAISLGVLAGVAFPANTVRAAAVSLDLSGWGWCVAYGEIGNVVLRLDGNTMPRADASEIADIYVTGTLHFNMGDRTDSIVLELRGTRVRSLFFLRQVSGGEQPLIAEFEGTWLGETDYVACEGRVAVPAPNHVAKPYFVILRTKEVGIPSRTPGSWTADLEFIIQKGAAAFDELADRIAASGEPIRDLLGRVATQMAVVARDIRALGIPYVT